MLRHLVLPLTAAGLLAGEALGQTGGNPSVHGSWLHWESPNGQRSYVALSPSQSRASGIALVCQDDVLFLSWTLLSELGVSETRGEAVWIQVDETPPWESTWLAQPGNPLMINWNAEDVERFVTEAAAGDQLAMRLATDRSSDSYPLDGFAEAAGRLRCGMSSQDSTGFNGAWLADLLFGEAVAAQETGNEEGSERAIKLWERELSVRRVLGDREAQGTTLYFLGATYAELGRPGLALARYREALAIAREVGDRLGEGMTLLNVSWVHQVTGQTDSALAYLDEALRVARDVGDRQIEGTALGNIGAIHDALGQPESALLSYVDALAITREINDQHGEAATLINIGVLHGKLGQPDSALARFASALAVSRASGDQRVEASVLFNTGAMHSSFGRPDSALAYFGHALALDRVIGDLYGERATLAQIGSVHYGTGRLDSALVYHAKALDIARDAGDRLGAGLSLNAIGAVQTELGRPDSALVYYQLALSIFHEVGSRAHEGETLGNIGLAHRDAGHPDSAIAYHQLALSISREIGNQAGESTALHNIGFTHHEAGRPDSALVYYRQALGIARRIRNRRAEGVTLGAIGSAQEVMGKPDSARAYFLQALMAHRETGNRQSEGLALHALGRLHHLSDLLVDPGSAIAYYDSAAVATASVARATGSDVDRMSYAERDVALFEHWPLALLGLAEEADPRPARLAALAAAERGRSQALLDLMRGTRVLEAGRDLTEEGARLIAPLSEAGVHGLSYLATNDTLLVWLIEPSGDVHVARRAVTRDSVAVLVADVRMSLGVDDAAGAARLAGGAQTPLEERLRTDVVGRRRTTGRWPGESARALSDLLLPGEFFDRLPGSGELVVVPSGPLNLIPFSALPVPGDGEPLGARYATRYTPSLATLAETEARSRVAGDAPPAPLIVGNPTMPAVPAGSRSEPLASLPGAEEESRWLASHLGTEPMIGGSATERSVRERIPDASLIHLATHGYAYGTEARARDSFVALGPGEGHDGLLTVGEVLDDPTLTLAAELVVLSACQTGLGDLKQAEGTVGLQRAFLAKGARSVLVSLWSVSDEATDLLMRSFYTHWLDDDDSPSKAEALRRAQEEVRTTPGFEHPRFWAAFQLVGAR